MKRMNGSLGLERHGMVVAMVGLIAGQPLVSPQILQALRAQQASQAT